MILKTFCFIVGVFIFLTCHTQLPSEKELFNYEKNAFYTVAQKEPANLPFLIVVIPNKIKEYFRDEHMSKENGLADSLRNDKYFHLTEPRPNYRLVANFDSSKALIFVQGINKKNSGGYEYRILKNNETNNTWKSFTEFYPATYTSSYGEDDPEMAVIGYIGANWENCVTIDVRKKLADTIISSVTILWLTHPPKVVATFAPNDFNKFLSLFKIRSQREISRYGAPPEDSVFIAKKEFASTENGIIFYLDDLIKQKLVEYKLQGPQVETEWKLNDLDFNFLWLKDLKPGKYKLLIRYSIQRHNVTEYDFEIKPAWQQTTLFKIIAGSLVAAFFGLIVIIVRIITHRNKHLKEQLEKEKTEIELKAIRSQLNPHFVYNSLNSIQNLINKNDIPNANKYLSQFSKLMRETLNTSDRKFNSIANEIEVLKTYLTLEQLRFGFSFEIIAKDTVDAETTEIPSLLLQPIVENAVKHGVENLKEKGFIRIEFSRVSKDLLILISDNGNGFTSIINKGYGLKLTVDRINLLNRILKNQLVELKTPDALYESSTIHLTFKNWFT